MICLEEFLNILESRGRDANIYLRGEWVGMFFAETKKFQMINAIPVESVYCEDQFEAEYF